MTPKQVNELVLNKGHEYLKDLSLKGFQAAVFDDVCEKIAASGTLENLTTEGIILATITAFKAAYELMKETINALLKVADSVSLNYRQQAFQFNRNSIL